MTNPTHLPDVITIDGPSGTGKGTIAQKLAQKLQWNYLDSGSLYRCVAWGVGHDGINHSDEQALECYLGELSIESKPAASGGFRLICQGCDVSDIIRQESIGLMASKLSSLSVIRRGLHSLQLSARRAPGLVTDGRDMGTVVFPDAKAKFFLVADAKERANRRFKQLQAAGIHVNLADIESDLIKRDERDKTRRFSPTVPAPDALVIDTSSMTIDEVMESVTFKIEDVLKLGLF